MSEVPSLKGRFQIKENNLIISDTEPEDDGKYTCRDVKSGESTDIEVIGKQTNYLSIEHLLREIFY